MARQPHVLQICHDAKGPFRTVAKQYAECFADCNIKTIFLCGEKSSELAKAIPGEVDFLRFGSDDLKGLKLGVAARVAKIIGDQVPDILIAHRYKPFFIALLLLIKTGVPLVLGVIHEYGFLRRWNRSVLSRFWPGNVLLIAVSEPVCKEVCTELPHLAGRVSLLPHASESIRLLDPTTARQKLGIPLESYCFGVIGRLVRKKNHELLIHAFAELDEGPYLSLVGDGILKEELEELAVKLGIERRVIFSGHHENAKTLMKAFDTFVFPSGPEEAFGLVLLEAMAASVPILSSDAPGPNSVIVDAAMKFRCNDKDDLVLKLRHMLSLTDRETAEFVGRGSRLLDEKYSLNAMLRKIRAVPEVALLAPIGTKRDA